MPALSPEAIRPLVLPYFPEPDATLIGQLSVYLDLLLRWNAHTNLTAIRDPETIVARHFGESLFAARHVPRSATTLLDLGSGAGFPGIPIQLVHPALNVTLAESQNKKAAFLQEAVRTLGLKTTVWSRRAESLPESRKFDVVTLRAVDDPQRALQEARSRLSSHGTLLHFTSASSVQTGAWSTNDFPVPLTGTVLRVSKRL